MTYNTNFSKLNSTTKFQLHCELVKHNETFDDIQVWGDNVEVLCWTKNRVYTTMKNGFVMSLPKEPKDD